MPYIANTLSTDVNYCFYGRTPTGSNEVRRSILISGKANVADKHFITRDGVTTKVTNEELEQLKKHPVFQKHLENGFIKISATEGRAENVKDLEKKDKSAPLTPKDYVEQGKEAPKTKPE